MISCSSARELIPPLEQLVSVLQYSYVSISCRREITTAYQSVETDGASVLHDETTHVSAVFNTFKCDDALTWLRRVVVRIGGTRCEYIHATEDGDKHP